MGKYASFINRHFDTMGESGDEILARCQWHDDRGKPNLYLNSVSGLYYCHSCGARGSLDGLMNGEVPEPDLHEVIARLHAKDHHTQIYPENWLDNFDFPLSLWKDRGFSDEIIRKFRLGYDPIRDMGTIPIRDSRGRVLGVINRRLDDMKPKYTFPKGFKKGRDLFGSSFVRSKYHKVALVEGPLDAVACWDARVPALAIHGSRLSEDQARLLHGLNVKQVVCMFDNDSNGINATISVKETLTGMQVLISQYLPTWYNQAGTGKLAKDPGELSAARRRFMFISAKHWTEMLK